MSTTIENQEVDLSIFDTYLPVTSDDVVTSDQPTMVINDSKINIPDVGEKLTQDGDANDDDDEDDDNEKTIDFIIDNALENTPQELKSSNLIESFKTLFDEKLLLPFDDDKDISEYSSEELKELIQANLDYKSSELKETISKDVINSFPDELKYAVEYFNKGGKDIKGLFKALADTFETSDLDINSLQDQEFIVRKYLENTNFGNGDVDLIEEQIEEWKESGHISKKAQSFKPKLDEINEKILQEKVIKQEEFNQKQKEKKKEYLDNIYNTLKPSELNGIKLNEKRQQFLWDELTNLKYESLTGRPTNLLGKLLEDYQFGKEPRYDLIAEATWLLADPEDYKNSIKTAVIKNVNTETIKKLKTEAGRNKNQGIESESEQIKNKIVKPAKNIFKT